MTFYCMNQPCSSPRGRSSMYMHSNKAELVCAIKLNYITDSWLPMLSLVLREKVRYEYIL